MARKPQSPEEVADYLANLLKKPAPRAPYSQAKRRPTVRKAPLRGSIKRREAPIEALGPETVTLLARHGINGVIYGPGRVTVPHELACSLREAEQRARDYDNTHWQEKARIIGSKGLRGEGGYKATPVAPALFSQSMEYGPGAGEVSGQEGSSLHVGQDGGLRFSDE